VRRVRMVHNRAAASACSSSAHSRAASCTTGRVSTCATHTMVFSSSTTWPGLVGDDLLDESGDHHGSLLGVGRGGVASWAVRRFQDRLRIGGGEVGGQIRAAGIDRLAGQHRGRGDRRGGRVGQGARPVGVHTGRQGRPARCVPPAPRPARRRPRAPAPAADPGLAGSPWSSGSAMITTVTTSISLAITALLNCSLTAGTAPPAGIPVRSTPHRQTFHRAGEADQHDRVRRAQPQQRRDLGMSRPGGAGTGRDSQPAEAVVMGGFPPGPRALDHARETGRGENNSSTKRRGTCRWRLAGCPVREGTTHPGSRPGVLGYAVAESGVHGVDGVWPAQGDVRSS